MKIEPYAPRPPAPAATEGRGRPSPGFADLLGKPGVASFAELPVFGRPHAVAAPAAPAAPGRSGAPAMPAGVAGTAAPLRAAAPAPVPAKAAHASPAAPHRPGDTKVCVPGRSQRSEPDGPASSERRAGEDVAPQTADASPKSEPLRRARPRPRQAPPKAGISLILREEDGEVSLVVGQGPLDPEQSAEARRLAASILAESGLALANFQLNGAPVGPDSTGKERGSHGTRSN